MRIKGKLLWGVLVCLTALLLLPTVRASADCGPKSVLTLIVDNPPEGAYIVSLLEYRGENAQASADYGVESGDPMLEAVTRYAEDGWTDYWFQDAKEWRRSNEAHQYEFYEFPVPYRVILSTESGGVYVSEAVETSKFSPTVRLDATTMTTGEGCINVHTAGINLAVFEQFLKTYLLTLILEAIVWKCFHLPWKPRRNTIVFFGTNTLTQLLLYVCLTVIDFAGSLVFLLTELLIFLAEILLYRKLLRGVSKKRATAYAITANAVSFLIGSWLYLILYVLFDL